MQSKYLGELHGISYSPWTEKARWALDHHRIVYRFVEHTLILGELALRARFKHWRGDFTVPAWIDNKSQAMDSYLIARRSDELSPQTPPLVPDSQRTAIEEVQSCSETALNALRGLVMHRILRDPEAQLESMPAFIPVNVKRLLYKLVVRAALRYLQYGFYRENWHSESEYLEQYRAALRKLATLFSPTRAQYIVGGGFTFADIAFATALIGIRPPEAPFYRQGPATRRVWSTPELEAEFAVLLRWRDAIYIKHRPKRIKL